MNEVGCFAVSSCLPAQGRRVRKCPAQVSTQAPSSRPINLTSANCKFSRLSLSLHKWLGSEIPLAAQGATRLVARDARDPLRWHASPYSFILTCHVQRSSIQISGSPRFFGSAVCTPCIARVLCMHAHCERVYEAAKKDVREVRCARVVCNVFLLSSDLRCLTDVTGHSSPRRLSQKRYIRQASCTSCPRTALR